MYLKQFIIILIVITFLTNLSNGVKKYLVNINNLNLKSYIHNTYMIEK